jgi:hypothetical protein
MSLSNPAGDAKSAAAGYTKALLDLLGDRQPLDVLPHGPARVRELAASVDDAALRHPEAEGKWSMLQVMQHLADTELAVGWRYRVAVAQNEPTITGFDQDAWVTHLWHGDEPAEDALAQFEAVRAANVRLLRRLTPEQWQRAGIHEERGRETVLHIARLSAAHDLAHLRQLERIRAGRQA